MPRLLACISLFILAATVAFTQPVVGAIENNYSYVLPGLPNYGIAQGSIFVLFGSSLATVSTGLQELPLQTTLDGVSVQFAVQGATTQALLYYVMPDQIAGVLPSATPIGAGTVTVTSGGQTSAPAPITVVQSAVGIAQDQSLYGGSAVAFDVNWKPLGPSNAANPGDFIVLYGSGAGPVSGDESVQQIPRNLSNLPLEVDIGGIPATVSYHGRSIYPGLDQFNVVIPVGAVGCSVSIVARSGDIVSNVAFVPIAAGSRICSDQVPGVSFGPLQVLTGKSSYNVGLLNFTNNVVSAPAMTVSGHVVPAHVETSVIAGGQFLREQGLQPGETFNTQLGVTGVAHSLGSCMVGSYTLPLAGLIANESGMPAPQPATQPPTQLNAGTALNFSGPNGKASAQYQAFQPGVYAGILTASGSNPPPFIPSTGGSFTIDNGGGGPDVGPFTTQINFPPLLVWSNMNSIASIDRTQDLTITWTGGDPAGFVEIEGNSNVITATQAIAVQFNCAAPVAAGQFTIPSSVLLALPPQPIPNGGFSPGLQLQNQTNFLFTAPSLDGGIISAQTISNLTVPYQ